MLVTYAAQGNTVYRFIRIAGYPIEKQFVRECRDNTEARAIANYYKISKA